MKTIEKITNEYSVKEVIRNSCEGISFEERNKIVKLANASPELLKRVARMKELVWFYFDSLPQDLKDELNPLRKSYREATD